MSQNSRQIDWEDLSAWLDGELPAPRAVEIDRLVRDEASWRDAAEQLRRMDAALDAWSVPAAAEDLSGRAIASVRRSRRHSLRAVRLVRWLVPASVAAAVLLTAVLWQNFRADSSSPVARAGPDDPIQRILEDVPVQDQFIVEHLEFFQTYQTCGVLAGNEAMLDAATLDAIDLLDVRGI